MAKKTTLAIIGLIIILLVSFVITAVLSTTAKSLKLRVSKLNNENSNLQEKISVLSLEKKDLEGKLVDLRAQLQTINKEKEELQHKNQELSFEISSLKDDSVRLNDEIKMKADSFESKIKELREKRVLAENSLLEIERKNKILEKKVNTVEKTLKDKEEELLTLKRKEAIISDSGDDESVELSPILVKAGMFDKPGASTAPLFVGRVLAVNKNNGFVIINLGLEAGVKIGSKYRVFKKDRVIAELQAIQVRENVSACDISKEIEEITINDTVK